MINVEVVYCPALITKMTLHRMCYETMTCIMGVCSYLIHMSEGTTPKIDQKWQETADTMNGLQ